MRLGGVGVGRMGGRMIAEWRRVKGRVEEFEGGKMEGGPVEQGYEALGRRYKTGGGRTADLDVLPNVPIPPFGLFQSEAPCHGEGTGRSSALQIDKEVGVVGCAEEGHWRLSTRAITLSRELES